MEKRELAADAGTEWAAIQRQIALVPGGVGLHTGETDLVDQQDKRGFFEQ